MPFKELKVEDWKDEIASGLEFRKIHGVEESWKENEALFYSVHRSQGNAGPNIIAASGDALLSALTIGNMEITIEARNPALVELAPLLENLDQSLLEDIDFVDHLDDTVLCAYLFGRGFLKFGYDSEFGYDPRYDLGEEGSTGTTLTQFDSKGKRIEFRGGVPGMPWVASVLPHDIVVPWGVRKFKWSPWVAHRVVRHIDDIKADPKYSNKKNLRPVLSMRDFSQSYSRTPQPFKTRRMTSSDVRQSEFNVGADYVELWEIHDRRTGRIKVAATGHNKLLRDEVDLMQLEGLPFVDVGFVPSSRAFWVTPDAKYLEKIQLEISDIALQSQKQRRISVLKFLYQDNAIEEEELLKALSGDVGAALKVTGGANPRDAIIPFQPGNNQQLWAEAEHSRRDAREVIGFSRNQFGEFDASTRRTASEAQLVAQGSSQRLSKRAKLLSRAVQESLRKINAIIFEFWKTPRSVSLMGPEGQPVFEQFVGTKLKGPYSYKVSFSEDTGLSKDARKGAILQLYAQLVQDPLIDQIQLRKTFLRAFNDPTLSKIFGQIESEANENGDVSTILSQLQSQGSSQGQGQGPPQVPQVQ